MDPIHRSVMHYSMHEIEKNLLNEEKENHLSKHSRYRRNVLHRHIEIKLKQSVYSGNRCAYYTCIEECD